jgi:predicted ATP-grasp superfamily ATP-dependent carboligase
MELVERTYRLSVLGLHKAACTTGILPDFDLAQARRRGGASGKAIVFARHSVKVGDTGGWRTQEDDVRDIPHNGNLIAAGAPVCTVFAVGADAAACYDALVKGAARIYAQLDR